MRIRHAEWRDYDDIQRIYAAARQYMRDSGNPTQWGDEWPPDEMVREDIEQQTSYVIEDETGVHGVFALVLGDDPTYDLIEDGAWLNDEPYATIHRIASDGAIRGVFEAAFGFSRNIEPNLRIDTHADNLTMQHVIEKTGFVHCGTIYHTDGTPRIAYQQPCERHER